MLTALEAVILGIVQGVAEWLPISSQGMTSLVMINLFGMEVKEAIPVSIWLHTGTLLSATIYFKKDVIEILRDLPGYARNMNSGIKEERSIITFLIVSTILTGLTGLPLIILATDMADISGKLATVLIGMLLIFTGVLQISASKKEARKELPSFNDSIVTGIAQGFAALPGISRSGITTSLLLLRNFDASQALKLSFLMSIPAVLVAEVGIAAMEMVTVDANSLLALLFAFIFGILTIDAFIKMARRFDFARFCIALGLLSLVAYFV